MMDHGESIYNIIPSTEVAKQKPPMYRSKHNGKIPPTASTFGQAQTSHPILTNYGGDAEEKVVPLKSHRSLGPAPGTVKPDPVRYMQKMTKRAPVAPLEEVQRDRPDLLVPSQLKPKIKPDLPKPGDRPIMGLVTSKNFVVANAVEAILTAPKKVSETAQDFLRKEDFGTVPKYLAHVKRDIEDECEYIRQLQQQEEEARAPQVRQLDEEERQEIIEGLKAKWEQVNTKFQASTHLTKLDTCGKVRRKEMYEAELAQIEKDIQRINRKNILVDQSYSAYY
eukprot:NODE_14722_length_1090_cov_7.134995.p1 GENE.NODE_14722_length_1090_cov_7.134995~~NODE_14722_length_1090_cov_7.134995.p1  ORF type:complete len:297 (-),score=67.49 NODE_14722_length_1090_cov_7.134995:198-1037(-)